MTSLAFTRGAGILFCLGRHSDQVQVLLGRKRGGRYHGQWSIPFGTLEASDHGDYRRCAVRETGQETCAELGEANLATCAGRLEAVLGLPRPILEVVGKAPVYRGPLYLRLVCTYRTYLVELAVAPTGWPNREFQTIGWYPLDQLPAPTHFLAAGAIRHFFG
jgi:8-oxo-dGTP pyrophosphatase MutT (NUDIX family)